MIEDCEEFEGFVEKFDEKENLAYFYLKSEDGEKYEGEYDLSKFKELGIRNHRRFHCKITTIVEFTPIPDKELTKEREAEIDEMLSRLGPDDAPQSDY